MKRTLLVLLLLVAASVTRSSSVGEFCVGALHAQAQGQDPVMPPPGNPGDPEPPKGAYCDRTKRAAHECHCHIKCVKDDAGNIRIDEDMTECRAYCHPKFCKCNAEDCNAPPAESKLKAGLKTVGNTAEGAAVIVGSSYAWYLLTHGHR